MKKGNIIGTIIILIALLLIAGGVWYAVSIPEAEAPMEEGGATSTENIVASSTEEKNTTSTSINETSATTSSIPTTISMEGWKTFHGEEVGLKRGITFLYPSEWDNENYGTGCGDSVCVAPFFAKNKKEQSMVALFSIENELHYVSGNLRKTKEVLESFQVVVDNYSATVEHRVVSSQTEGLYKEWILTIPHVKGSSEAPNRYEFHMKDLYTNSEEVFQKIIESIHIEPYEEFKKKL